MHGADLFADAPDLAAVRCPVDRPVVRPVACAAVAALYVEPKGCYVGVPGVESWDEARDARKYRGPHPVVAHPPCQRWGKFWHGSTRKPHQYRLGEDGGCFAAAMTAVRNYGGVLEHLAAIAWAYLGKPLSALPDVARAVTAHGAAERLAPATVRNRLACLKAACRWGWKTHGMTPHDPTTRMQLPQVRNERQVYATRAQVGQLARAADRRDLRVVILLAFYTGLRLGEILRAEMVPGALVVRDTKNGDPRAVPVHPRAARLLQHLPIAAPKITLQRAFERARVRAKLPHIHLHDLRHSTASELINAGVDLYRVGTILGHRDPRSTKRYAHLRHATLADDVAKIGRKLKA